MSTIFVICGRAQFDEESLHWNARAFSTRDDAARYIGEIEIKIKEFAPRLHDYLAKNFTDGTTPGGSISWEESLRKRKMAEQCFRDRIGDAGFAAFYDPEAAEYTIEELELS